MLKLASEGAVAIVTILQNLCQLVEKIYICLIDDKKVFDCVNHDKLWKALKDLGVANHLVKLMHLLYINQEFTIQTLYGNMDWLKIEAWQGVQQGCILSPFFLNLCVKVIMKKLELVESKIRIKIRRRNINNFLYSDDTTVF